MAAARYKVIKSSPVLKFTSEKKVMAPPKTRQMSAENVTERGDVQTGDEKEELQEQSFEILRLKLEMKRMEMEREIQLAKMEADKEKEMQFAKMEAERERERVQRKHERVMYQLRLQERGTEGEMLNQHVFSEFSAKLKRFSKFQKGDDIEAFLSSFERTCVELEISEKSKMAYIKQLISGELNQVYADMRDEEITNCQLFKERVKITFSITPEQSRRNFREIKRKIGETYTQLGARLDKVLDRWVEGSQVTTFRQLKQLIALEQFHKLVPIQMRWYIRDIDNVARIATILDELEGDFEMGNMNIQYKKHYREKAGNFIIKNSMGEIVTLIERK
nr:PREDICTED: uncharacterized protein LOC107982677 [Anolis carolinensis]|eukprot:XP_016848093.1 PREDICTED: uncharacterized protein LOC107982677 [Anolis carolinensis]